MDARRGDDALCVICPALASNLDAAAVNDAARPAKQPATDKVSASVVKLQVMLDRAQFSPGESDGKLGENAHGTAESGKVSEPTSHGCIRLTNWDVRTLGDNVKRASN
ncbi:L,D-transpeptidase family protein [Bradyrhizobium japonicum]|uniref:L,D-transpeptidase family protein n=1 Tax=Bradyrhizobium japonicum TaxID=375 RepID=UPI002714997A|nr:L,D-transpeptidase family protein [Bradyrhizobium japonicum]WLB51972.1 L,D-transpeptidase family protein [Bradyrhizobium japonicum]WLB66255.1 L,D-transpeptidase family protein [Bradyrhizobium japonicum]